MRRLPLLLSATAVVGLALTFNFPAPASEAGASPAMANIPINMTIGCAGNDLGDVRIVPYTARLSKGQDDRARWQLMQASDVAVVTIRVKEDSSWPFASPTPPFNVSRGGGNAVTSGPINASASGTYLYDIFVDCGSGPTRIDPRMEIDS